MHLTNIRSVCCSIFNEMKKIYPPWEKTDYTLLWANPDMYLYVPNMFSVDTFAPLEL